METNPGLLGVRRSSSRQTVVLCIRKGSARGRALGNRGSSALEMLKLRGSWDSQLEMLDKQVWQKSGLECKAWKFISLLMILEAHQGGLFSLERNGTERRGPQDT